MTSSTDFDRLITSWLETSAPGGIDETVVDRALTAARRVERRRGLNAIVLGPPPWPNRPAWRSLQMNRILVALGATVAIVVAGFALWPRPTTGPGTTVTPSPSAAVASPSPSAVSSPASLGDPIAGTLPGRWMGGTNPLVGAPTGSSLMLGQSTLSIHEPNNNQAAGFVVGAGVSDHELRLRSDATGICQATDVGRYHWSLSASGRVLTVVLSDDPCSQRAASVAGAWWKMLCRDPATNCLGELDAGTYESEFVTPLAATTDAWSPLFGGVTYTVPDGWANYADWPDFYGLAPVEPFSITSAENVEPASRIVVYARAVPSDTDVPCAGDASKTPPVHAAAFAAQLATRPGLTATAPTSTTIDGHPGVWLDLTKTAGTVGQCPDDPVVEYLISGSQSQAIGANARQRVYLVDVGTDTPAAIVIAADDAADFDALVAGATPIIESMHFK